jgi:hypothetical protein
MAVTVQMQFESAVTEMYQDAFVGSAIENGTTITAISGDLLSAVISIRCILGFRKDNPNVFNMLVQNLPITRCLFRKSFPSLLSGQRWG